MEKIQQSSFTHYKKLEMEDKPKKITLTYRFVCDQSWRDLGKTIFADNRAYQARNKEFVLEEEE